MIYLNETIRIGADDEITIYCNNEPINAVVLNSGDGTSTPYDDPYYWLYAPSRGISPSASNPQEMVSIYLLTKINTIKIPFSELPQKVQIQPSGTEEKFDFFITAIIGCNKRHNGYMVYLDFIK